MSDVQGLPGQFELLYSGQVSWRGWVGVPVLLGSLILAMVLWWPRERPLEIRPDVATVPAIPGCADMRCALGEARVLVRETSHWNGKSVLSLRRLAYALRGAISREDCAAANDVASTIRRQLADDELSWWRAAVGRIVAPCRGTPARTLPSPRYAKSTVRLQREACEGTCPKYDLEVRFDGRVRWLGKSFVAVEGSHEDYVDPRDVASLLASIETLRFDEIPAKEPSIQYDAGAIELELELATGERFPVSRSAPCGTTVDLERGLCYIAARIDEAARSARWVGHD